MLICFGSFRCSAGALARVCGLPRTCIERVASEQTGITADTALRLAKALRTTAQLWLNLQTDYDVQVARRNLARCHTLPGQAPATDSRSSNQFPSALVIRKPKTSANAALSRAMSWLPSRALLSDPFPCAPVLQDSDYFVELWGARAFPSRLFVAEQRTRRPIFRP